MKVKAPGTLAHEAPLAPGPSGSPPESGHRLRCLASNGSGASSAKAGLTVLVLAVTALTLLAFAPGLQAKVVVGGFGTGGSQGGQFFYQTGLAVNQNGAGGVVPGTVYVADVSLSNIQRFSPGGAFERSWGENVIADGQPGDTGTGFEICTVAAECQQGSSGPSTENGGQVTTRFGIGIDQSTGDVYVSDSNNNRVSEFSADGQFIRAWGWDVITEGRPNDQGSGFEICDTTAGNAITDCQRGSFGDGAGQLGYGIGAPSIDSSGRVWIADAPSHRLQVFSSEGSFLKAIGIGVVTDGAEGTGTLTANSNVVTSLNTTKRDFEVGRIVTAAGIPPGTRITAVGSSFLTLSNEATESGPRTLTVAAGAGNVPVNERQTLTFRNTPTAGAFAVGFRGATTGGTGSVRGEGGSRTFTELNVTSGEFKVGQLATVKLAGTENVVPPGTRITEVGPDYVTLSNPAGHSDPYQELASFDLPFDASAAEVEADFNGLSTIGDVGGYVSVTGPAGGPYQIEFGGDKFAGADIPEVSASTGGLLPETPYGAQGFEVTSENPGGLEVCTVPTDCRGGLAGSAPGQFGTFSSPSAVDLDSAGNAYAIDYWNKQVLKFNAGLTSVTPFGAGLVAPFTSQAPLAIKATQGGTHLLFAVNNSISANPSEVQIVDLDLTTNSVDEVSLAGSGINSETYLAEDENSGILYVSTTDFDSPFRILRLSSASLADPEVTLDPVTSITEEGAKFSGSVDPKDGLVKCAYEYGDPETGWTVVKESECAGLASSGGSQPVSEPVGGLVPNTSYEVRLAVGRPLNPSAARISPTRSFTTSVVPPILDNATAIRTGDTSIRVVARLNPRHSDTSFTVEYGTTPSLGQTTEAVDAGAANSPRMVSQVIDGLAPSTAYYFKVIATNAAGSVESSVETVKTRATPRPSPSGRVYEQVTPPDKASANIDALIVGGSLGLSIAGDGNAISYCTSLSFTDTPPPVPALCAWYASRRTDSGWKSKGVVPPSCPYVHNENQGGIGSNADAWGFDRNIDKALLGHPEGADCPIPPLDPAAPTPGKNLYLSDLLSASPSYDLISTAPEASPRYASGPTAVYGGSDNFSHVIYASTGQQTADAPAGNFPKLYDWHDGTQTLISRKPDGDPFETATAVVAKANAYNGISSDGNRVLFTNPVPQVGYLDYFCFSEKCHIYMSEHGETIDVSASECTAAPCPADAASFFEMATTDVSSVWFKSTAKLTNDDTSTSGADLYMYRGSADPANDPDNLTLLSKDEEPSDGTEAQVEAMLGSSDDGDVVYFAAAKQIVAGSPTAPGYKIYKWSWNDGTPAIEYVLTLPEDSREQALNWFGPSGEYPYLQGFQYHVVSGDGKYVLVLTRAQLSPRIDYDEQIDYYRWDAVDGLVCVTCQEPGQASASDSYARIPGLPGINPSASFQSRSRNMSADGQRVFFQTADRLVPDDVNDVEDVYEWNDGTLSLISTGHGSERSYFVGMDETAKNAFFVTSDKLVGWDVDSNSDIYDARLGGGLPEPTPEPAPCEAESCRSAGSPAGKSAGAGTGVFEGPGNERGKNLTCKKGFKKRFVQGREVCRRVKKHHKKTRRAKHRHGSAANHRGVSR